MTAQGDTTGRPPARGANITHCPHCGSVCRTIKTKQLAPTYRELTFLCLNDACRYLFVAGLTAVRTLSPPLERPNPEVHIPGPVRGAT